MNQDLEAGNGQILIIDKTGLLRVRLSSHQENFYKWSVGSSPHKLFSQDWMALWLRRAGKWAGCRFPRWGILARANVLTMMVPMTKESWGRSVFFSWTNWQSQREYMNQGKTYLKSSLFRATLMLWEALSPVLGLVSSPLFPSWFPPWLCFPAENIKMERGNLLCPIPLMPCTDQLL